jgi:hypothetical protein
MIRRQTLPILLFAGLVSPLLAVDTGWIARLGGKVERDSAGGSL